MSEAPDREFFTPLTEEELVQLSNEFWALGQKAHDERNVQEARKNRDISRILFKKSLAKKVSKDPQVRADIQSFLKDSFS